jgi:uncharacterized protein YjbJ (UPF0337 family)
MGVRLKNRDTAQGKFDQLKGKAKQSVGEALSKDRLANSGAADQVKGAVREAWGNAKEAVQSGAQAHTQATAHDVREKMTSTAQNVKNAVNDKAERFKEQHKRAS